MPSYVRSFRVTTAPRHRRRSPRARRCVRCLKSSCEGVDPCTHHNSSAHFSFMIVKIFVRTGLLLPRDIVDVQSVPGGACLKSPGLGDGGGLLISRTMGCHMRVFRAMATHVRPCREITVLQHRRRSPRARRCVMCLNSSYKGANPCKKLKSSSHFPLSLSKSSFVQGYYCPATSSTYKACPSVRASSHRGWETVVTLACLSRGLFA